MKINVYIIRSSLLIYAKFIQLNSLIYRCLYAYHYYSLSMAISEYVCNIMLFN